MHIYIKLLNFWFDINDFGKYALSNFLPQKILKNMIGKQLYKNATLLRFP